MTGFHVFLVVVGLIIIIVSFIISEKVIETQEQTKEGIPVSPLSSLESSNAKEQIKVMIQEEIDIAMVETKDKLNHISNEKIMAVSEYSDQILEKIDQNHKEVVFLYNMLNEKEETIRKMFSNTNTNERQVKTVRERTGNGKSNEKPLERLKNTQLKENEPEQTKETLKNQKLKNEQILKLYSEGKSIVEIAKILEIGQGEIKLVIGLAQGEKA